MNFLDLAKTKGHDVDSLQNALLAFMLKHYGMHGQEKATCIKIEKIESGEAHAIRLDQSLQDLSELRQQEEEEAKKKQEEEEAQTRKGRSQTSDQCQACHMRNPELIKLFGSSLALAWALPLVRIINYMCLRLV